MKNALQNIDKTDFEMLIKFASRSNVLFGVEVPALIYMPYRFVKIDLPELFSSLNIEEIFKTICSNHNIEEKEINQIEIISFLLWIKDEIEAIQKLEQTHLSSTPDPDMEAAGVQELNQLGEINTIDSLAGGDILKWELVEQLPYNKVFDKLLKNLIENKVNKNYHKIISSKKK